MIIAKTNALVEFVPQHGASRQENIVSEKIVKFTLEKETKNSVRYKEVPEAGQPPIIGSLYVQKWYAGDSKNLEVTLVKKD